MTDALRTALEARGARFESDDSDTPQHYGDPGSELVSLGARCGWSVEHPGAVIAAGGDFLDLLNRLSTNEVHDLASGEARATVLTSPKGRIVARLWCHHLGDPGVLVLTGPGAAAAVIAHLDRYTFAEDTRLSDASHRYVMFAVRGPRSSDVAAMLFDETPAPGVTLTRAVEGRSVHALGHDLLGGQGFTIVAELPDAPAIVDALDAAVRGAGGLPVGSLAVEPWRIGHGLPRAGTELDEEHNPLEAGLRDAVNFSKGCYVGQEVVARLETYDKVSRRLMVVRPSDSATRAPVSGDTLTREGRAIGSITSAAVVPGGTAWIALAYVKRSRGEHGSAVGIGGDERDGGRGVVLNPPVDPLG